MKDRHPRGIRRIETGWQAYVRVRGKFLSKVFPPQTAILVMRRWREEQRVRARLGALLPPTGNTLGEDVASYLEQVATMPTLRDRRDDLERWLKVFGRDCIRANITSGVIRAQLEAWRADGYAASTCNHRRTALMHLWSVLDGKSAPNPAKDVPRYQSPQGPPRALSYAAVVVLLRLMAPSQTKARLTLMAWTGWPPAQIAKLTPEDIRWDESVFVRARRKGKGAAGVWLPLLPQAWAALREFKALGCWGPYSTSSARASFRRAADRVNRIMLPLALHAELRDITPYQLRHAFLTLVASITQDDRAVQTLAQHADIRMTHRYTSATVDPRVAAAMVKVQIALDANPKA